MRVSRKSQNRESHNSRGQGNGKAERAGASANSARRHLDLGNRKNQENRENRKNRMQERRRKSARGVPKVPAPLAVDSRLAVYLMDGEEERDSSRKKGRRWRGYFGEILKRIHARGHKRISIMLIPHTEKRIINWHLNIYTITGIIAILAVVLASSVISLVGKSGKEVQFYDMGLTNRQFNMQSVRMAEEMIPLHTFIATYSNTIKELYKNLSDDDSTLEGQGGFADPVVDAEITKLDQLVEQCRSLGEDCSQETTEDILRRVIYLSHLDNQIIRHAVDVSERILVELKSQKKQNLFRNTPSIWPVRGYLLSGYGLQTDPFQGRELFKRGIGIGAIPGTEVLATAPGTVEDISYDEQYGLKVYIKHLYGIATFYAHLDRVGVKEGDQVRKGQGIGYAGRSGSAPTDMLYYEVHVGTVAYDPRAFLNSMQYLWLNPPKS